MIGDITELRDMHKGERCFILGTGPSLLEQDLTLLKNEILFMSPVFPLYPQFELIKPRYYCNEDTIAWLGDNCPGMLLEVKEKIREAKTTNFFPEDFKTDAEKWFPENTNYYLKKSGNSVEKIKSINLDLVSTQGLDSGGSIIIDYCLPIAYYMGFKEIYLLGCDCDWKLDEAPDMSKSHFYGYVETTPIPGGNPIEWYAKWYQIVINSYEIAKEAFEKGGRKIHNATLGGKLEVFERVKLEDVIG